MLSESEVKDLLRKYRAILDQLRDSEIIRTENSPVGDYAEWLVARRLGLNLVHNNQAKYDAVDVDDGTRYQIKARRVTSPNQPPQLSPFRNLESAGFDQLIVVLFDADFEVQHVYRIPHSTVLKYARKVEYLNGHLLIIRKELVNAPEVKDLTDQFRDAN